MLGILSLFSVERSQLTVEQVARELGSSVSTTYRYFRSLASAGLIEQASGGRYILGPAAVQLDWLIRRTDPMIHAAAPAMYLLGGAVEIPAVILLCRLYRGQIMCTAQTAIRAPHFASSYQRGKPMPLIRGAASKVILANMPAATAKRLYNQHDAEMAAAGLGDDWPAVRTSLKAIQSAGICTTSGEIDYGLTGIAAPILGVEATPAGCIAIVVATATLRQKSTASLSNLVQTAGAQISASLALT